MYELPECGIREENTFQRIDLLAIEIKLACWKLGVNKTSIDQTLD